MTLDHYSPFTSTFWEISRRSLIKCPSWTKVQPLNYFSSWMPLQYITLSTSFQLVSYSSTLWLSTLSCAGERWATVWVMASVWPAAQIQNLARDLCTNLSIRGCRLPAQNFLPQLSFYINYSGKACESPKSLSAEFEERPSGVMSKKLGTKL